MMRKIILLLGFTLCFGLFLPGCGKIKGPRFWWDDRTQERLPEDYALPEDPSAPDELGDSKPADPSGEDLTDQNLDDYRTDFDAEEQRAQERNVPKGFMDRGKTGNRL